MKEKRIEASWQLDEPESRIQWKEVEKVLSEAPVLKMLQPKLIGLLSGPVTKPQKPSGLRNAVRVLIQLLKEAGFTPGVFGASDLLDIGEDGIVAAASNLFKKLYPLVGARDPAAQNKEYNSETSKYASAGSEVESNNSISVQRMSPSS